MKTIPGVHRLVTSVPEKVCEEETTPQTHITESVVITHTEEKTPESCVRKACKVASKKNPELEECVRIIPEADIVVTSVPDKVCEEEISPHVTKLTEEKSPQTHDVNKLLKHVLH